jgi:hypothetical protein
MLVLESCLSVDGGGNGGGGVMGNMEGMRIWDE